MARESPQGYRPGDPLVIFRRIPGTRAYYNAADYSETAPTGQRFTEHFVIRRYNPSRSAEEREQIRREAARYRGSMARGRNRYRRSFRLASEARGHTPDSPEEVRRFNRLYTRYIRLNHEARRVTKLTTRAQWDELHGPNSELARVLNELGMRRDNERIPVTTSPKAYFEGWARPFFDTIVRTGSPPRRRAY